MTGYTADSSVVVPALTSWHVSHELARAAVVDVRRLPGHVVIEVVAVLTRLPHGLAVPVRAAALVVTEAFPDAPWLLDSRAHQSFVARIADSSLRGGQVYDALVAATALQAGATLLTRDRRALPAYRAMDVGVEFVE